MKTKEENICPVVRKSNVFIEGRYRFGLHEQKILLLIISQVDDEQADFMPYRVRWEDIKTASKGKINTVKKIDKACTKLKNKTISIKKGEVTDNFGFLSGWTTHQGKYVEFRIDPGMKKMLLGLMKAGNFTLYELEFAMSLSSAHAIRIYEILKSMAWRRQPVTIKLNDIKNSLDIPLNTGTYKDFGSFRRNIINKAQKSINEKTDINFEYEVNKIGRKVDSIDFKIETNKKEKCSGTSPGRTFVRPGDVVIINEKEYLVQSSFCEYEQQTIPIGDLTKMLKAGEITIK